jgi:hypothetical protein
MTRWIAAAAFAVVAACSGPRATATATKLRPSARSGFYRVETRLVNAGGRGQVELTVRLQNKANGHIVTQTQSVDLERRDHTDVALEIPAPPGDYDVDARVEYPPR